MKKFALIFMSLVSTAAVAEPVLLATSRLSPLIDANALRINSCRADEMDRIAVIQIHAVDRTANLQQIQVQYGNLNTDVIDLRQTLLPGQSTGWIDLGGRGNCVLSVRILGSNGSDQFSQPTIDIYGMRQMRDMRDRREEMPPPPPMRPGPGWGRDGRGQMDPRGGRGQVDPRDGRGQMDPRGGRGQVDPRGGRGQVDPGQSRDDVRGGLVQAPAPQQQQQQPPQQRQPQPQQQPQPDRGGGQRDGTGQGSGQQDPRPPRPPRN